MKHENGRYLVLTLSVTHEGVFTEVRDRSAKVTHCSNRDNERHKPVTWTNCIYNKPYGSGLRGL